MASGDGGLQGSSQWLEIQTNSFLQWVNHHLEKRGLHVEDLSQDFADGTRLIQLLEIITGQTFPRYTRNPRFPAQKMANVTEAFNFMERVMKIRVVGCNATDIVEGSQKQMMGVIFLLINKAKTIDFDNVVPASPRNAPSDSKQSPSKGTDAPQKLDSPRRMDSPRRLESPRAQTQSAPQVAPHVTAPAKEPAAVAAPAEPAIHVETAAQEEYTIDDLDVDLDVGDMKEPVEEAGKKVPPTRPHRSAAVALKPEHIKPDSLEEPARRVPYPRDKRNSIPNPMRPRETSVVPPPPLNKDKPDVKDSTKPKRSSSRRSSKQMGKDEVAAGLVDEEAASLRAELIKSKSYEQHILKLQTMFRAAAARQKRAALIKSREQLVASFSGRSANGIVRIQAIARGRIVRAQMKKRRRRNEISKEIVMTEETYVRNLQVLVDVYLKALKALGEDVIPAATLRVIFSEIEVIKSYNNIIVQKLRARMQKWYSEGQKMGDIFLQLTPFLKVYTAYVNNYNLALRTVSTLSQNAKVAKALMDCRMDASTNGLELTSFLIMPIQRIPRYVMLLSDLFKNTPADHPDYVDLKKALASMESVADYVNQKKREAENLMGVLVISKHITEMVNPNELAQPHRRYVRQGAVQEVEQGAKRSTKSRYCFLFNDMLLVTKEPSSFNSFMSKLSKERGVPISNLDLDTLRTSDLNFKYQYILPLVGAKLVDVIDAKNPNAFEIHLNSLAAIAGPGGVGGAGALPQQAFDSLQASLSEAGQRRVQFIAPTPQLKDEWLLDLDEQMMSCLEKRRSRLEIPADEEKAYEKPAAGAVRTTMRGPLLKRGQAGDWAERYCSVQEDILRYWKSRAAYDAGEPPANVIPLLFASVQLAAVMDRPHCFQVLTRERIYNFSIPPSSAINPVFERLVWVTTVRDAIFTHITDIETKKAKDSKEVKEVKEIKDIKESSGPSSRDSSPAPARASVALDASVVLGASAVASASAVVKTKKQGRSDSASSTESSPAEERKDKKKSLTPKTRASISKIAKIGELSRISSSATDGFKKWKLVLKNGELSLFKPKRSKPSSVIDLVVCPPLEEPETKEFADEKYVYFSLQTTDRVYKLGSTDATDVADWVQKLNDSIRTLTGK